MASTSGRIQTGSANYSYFYLQWQLASQNTDGNYSTLNWQWGINLSNGAFWQSNAVKSVSGHINGGTIFGSGTWSNISGNGDHQLLSGSITIGHNSDGTKSFGADETGWLYANGNLSASGSWTLPTIPRYADITSFTATNVTDEGLTLSATTNRSASTLDFSIDGGTTYGNGGSGTSASHDFHNLLSEHTYTCYVRSISASSGLTAYAGPVTATTNEQGSFLFFL